MSVEEKAQELNYLAEKIRGSFTNFNSQFKKLSEKTNRIKKNTLENKKRKSKLKTSSSSFGRTVKNVSTKVTPNSRSMFGGLNMSSLIGPALLALPLIAKVLGFAAVTLFGVLAFNKLKVNKKLDDDSDDLTKKSDNAGNFFIKLVDGLKGFIGGIGSMEEKVDKTFDDVDNSVKVMENDFKGLRKDADSLDDFNLSKLLTNSSGEDDKEEERESDEGVDSRFKKPSPSSINAAASGSEVKKNAQETTSALKKEGIELVNFGDRSNLETYNTFINTLDKQNMSTSNLEFLSMPDPDDDSSQIIIVKQKTIVKE